jgi:hypothetical protein
MKTNRDSTVYRIAKWDEVFETAESRRHKSLTWVSMPVGFASHGYQSLIDEFGDDAPAIYGSWCALVSLASTMPRRGIIASSRGIPLSLRQIARLTFFPQNNFERLFEWASRPEIGWIIIDSWQDLEHTDAEKTPAQATPSHRPGDAQANTGLPNPTQQDLTQPNPTQPNKTNWGSSSVVGGGDSVEGGGRVLGRSDFDPVTTEAVVELAKRLSLPFALEQRQRGQVARLALAAGVRSGLLELARACGSTTVRSPSRYWQRGLVKLFSEAGVDYAESLKALQELADRKAATA